MITPETDTAAATETDEMKEIMNDFLVEADELVASLDDNLVKLEETPDDLELLNEIFRAAHTIKGTSGFLALDEITSLTHKMEDVLNKLRKGALRVNGDIMDVLLKSIDMLKLLLADLTQGSNSRRDTRSLKAQLETISEGEDSPAAPETIPQTASSTKSEHKESTGKNRDETIRVDVNRLDTLMNLMGELVLGRNALMQVSNCFAREHEDLEEVDDLNRAGSQISFITTEIQMAVMKMRMFPIGKVFGKFPRLVRDLARESAKKIRLEISGEETEIDKSVIEHISDPLVHLIRNSCDHGIEMPEDRIAAGKTETGTLRLGAAQEGSNIVITIEDDGRGLDVEAIRDRAVKRGLITAAETEHLSDRDIHNFIFQPGFSTAQKITGISGRGVGMDVVRTNIEKLKGLIDIESQPGERTKIIIKLPLTLAIVQGLLVVSEGETFVIPLSSVLETIRITAGDIESVNKREVIVMRDGVLPIVNLGKVLRGDKAENSRDRKRYYVVVVGLAEHRLGLIVDKLLGQEEVVIKSMGHFLGKIQGVAGATILGDGRVRLIVDLLGLFELAAKGK